jgi:hypothetical protein
LFSKRFPSRNISPNPKPINFPKPQTSPPHKPTQKTFINTITKTSKPTQTLPKKSFLDTETVQNFSCKIPTVLDENRASYWLSKACVKGLKKPSVSGSFNGNFGNSSRCVKKGLKGTLNVTAKPDYLYSANLNISKGGVVRDLNRKMVNGFGGGGLGVGLGLRSRAAGMLQDMVKKREISGLSDFGRGPSKGSDRNSKLSNGGGSRSPCLNLNARSNGSIASCAKVLGSTFGRKESLSEKILFKSGASGGKQEKNLLGAGEIGSKSTFRFMKKSGLLGSSDQKESQNQGSR